MTDDLLTIGRFARAAGLSIDTLRHWDAEGLLIPAEVDSATGYRRYRPDQTAQARAIAALRDLELSLPAIRALLEADDSDRRAQILGLERIRLEARTARLQRALHRLSMIALASSPSLPRPEANHPGPVVPEKEIHVPTPPKPPVLEPATHRALGIGLFNRTWELFETEDRTPAQDDEMIDTAHASAWHWRQVGNAANLARAHWLLSRTYAVLGRAEPSLHHARRALAVVEAGGEGLEDFDFPGAAEAMARALALSGDMAAAAAWKARATEAAALISNTGDRSVIEGDLETLPV